MKLSECYLLALFFSFAPTASQAQTDIKWQIVSEGKNYTPVSGSFKMPFTKKAEVKAVASDRSGVSKVELDIYYSTSCSKDALNLAQSKNGVGYKKTGDPGGRKTPAVLSCRTELGFIKCQQGFSLKSASITVWAIATNKNGVVKKSQLIITGYPAVTKDTNCSYRDCQDGFQWCRTSCACINVRGNCSEW